MVGAAVGERAQIDCTQEVSPGCKSNLSFEFEVWNSVEEPNGIVCVSNVDPCTIEGRADLFFGGFRWNVQQKDL